MIADGGWKDAFAEFLVKGAEGGHGMREEMVQALKRLLASEKYRQGIVECLTSMLRGRGGSGVALSYIAGLESEELSRALKKELMIIARGDIGENQQNAIKAIAAMKQDEDVRKSLIILLSHWDASARLAAAEVLEGLSSEPDVRAAAEKRLNSESDEDVKRVLQKIVG
jgi:HEAT repeat protein